MGLFWTTRWERQVEDLLRAIHEEIWHMQKALQELEAAVAQQTTVTESAVTMLTQLASQIEADAEDPKALRKLAQDIQKNTEKLASALIQGTDAEGEEK